MKRFLNLKMWGYFLMMALCVSITACSEDDEENENGGGGSSSSSFIGTSMQVTEDGETENFLFTYDSQGRIIKVSSTRTDITYTYENDKIIVTEKNTEYDSWYYRTIYNLNNKGLIISSESGENGYNYDEYIYEYDEQNRLIRCTSDYDWNEFIWNGGNIVKDGYYDITYYEGKEDTKGINGFVLDIGDMDEVLYAGGYFGQKSANLIKSAYGENYSYSWEGNNVKTMSGEYYDDYYQRNETWTITFNF